MTKLLVTVAALGLTISAASACEYMRSAKASVDQTVVASIEGQSQQMSVPEQQLLLPPTDSTVPAGPGNE